MQSRDREQTVRYFVGFCGTLPKSAHQDFVYNISFDSCMLLLGPSDNHLQIQLSLDVVYVSDACVVGNTSYALGLPCTFHRLYFRDHALK